MNNQIEILLQEAENRWLDLMNQQVYANFSDFFLPSHDASHHRRVWEYGRKILLSLSEHNHHIDQSFVDGLLISIFFHDQGMVLTRKTDHGKASRQICEIFFEENKIKEPDNFQDILQAIESHDIKDEHYYADIPVDERPELLSLLSMADDLDALGIIGIYRYAEIYLHRGIDIRKIGIRVMENVSTRFNNFSKGCYLCPDLINEFKQSYKEIISFFDKYNQQLLTDSNPYTEFSGHVGIINYIKNFSVMGEIHPSGYCNALENFEVTKFVKDFFIKLEYKMSPYV